MEIDIGTELFERSGRSLSVTDKGLELYSYAKSVIREAGQFDEKVESLFFGQPSVLTIGVDTSINNQEIADIIASFSKEFPNIDLVLLAGETSQVESWVIDQKADAAILMSTLNYPMTLSISRAFHFQLCMIAQQSVPNKLNTQNISLAELKGLRQLTYNIFLEAGLNNIQQIGSRTHLVSNTFQMLDLVKAGLGWAILPRFICDKALADGSVYEIYIDGQPTTETWAAGVIWRLDKPLNEASERLLALFRSLNDR